MDGSLTQVEGYGEGSEDREGSTMTMIVGKDHFGQELSVESR